MLKKKMLGYSVLVLAVALFFTPFAILMIIRGDEWFKVAGDADLVVGVMLGLFYAILVLKGALRYISNMLAGLISLIIFTSIFYFIRAIISDLFWISLSVLIGYFLFWGLAAFGKRQVEIAKIYADEGFKIKAREAASTQQLSKRARNINAIK